MSCVRFAAGLLLIPWVTVLRAELPTASRGLVQSETHCVFNADQLQTALDTAGSNNKLDIIRLASGAYTSAGGFSYSQNESGKFNITLSGGWSGCTTQTGTPLQTMLSRSSQGPILDMDFFSDADLRIENLSIQDGVGEGSSPGPSGLIITGVLAQVNATLDRIRLFNNMGQNLAVTVTGEARLRNSVIIYNHDSTASVAGDPLYLVNNTVVSNTLTTVSELSVGGFNAGCSLPCRALFVNNIFWDNDGADLRIPDSSPMVTMILKNNNIDDLSGVPTEDVGNRSEDPGFLFEFLPPELNFDSPMVDQGARPPTFLPTDPPFEDDWGYGPVDFHGDDRVQGARVDIGAVEAFPEVIFANGYE